jgi:hypothetical protein
MLSLDTLHLCHALRMYQLCFPGTLINVRAGTEAYRNMPNTNVILTYESEDPGFVKRFTHYHALYTEKTLNAVMIIANSGAFSPVYAGLQPLYADTLPDRFYILLEGALDSGAVETLQKVRSRCNANRLPDAEEFIAALELFIKPRVPELVKLFTDIQNRITRKIRSLKDTS